MDFTTRGTMLEALLTTEVGAGSAETPVAPETLGMLQLLQGRLVTEANMDRLLVSPEQVLVAVINQFGKVPALRKHVLSMIKSVGTSAGLAAVRCWKEIMEYHHHGQVPHSWNKHTRGCLDADGWTQLDVAIRKYHEDTAAAFLASPYGAFACRRVRRDGGTALLLALDYHSLELCGQMLDKFGVEGCSAASVTREGVTALMVACKRGYHDIALRLLESGAEACNAWHVDEQGNTAYLLAKKKKGLQDVVSRLKELVAPSCVMAQELASSRQALDTETMETLSAAPLFLTQACSGGTVDARQPACVC